MAFKDDWKDLQNATDGVAGSGDDISVESINMIAHAVIQNETTIGGKVNKENGKGLSTIDFDYRWAEMVDSAYWGVEDLMRPPYTEIPSTLYPNYQYNFGEVETLNLAFPTVATDGDVVYLTFKSGNTPTALTIDTTNTSDIECIPEANTGYEIFGKYNGEIWIVNYSEYTVSEV